jgi:outer membrane protein assembly factor BamE
MRIIAIALCCAFVASCSFVYRIDVQQGNYVTQDLVAKLKAGMTKAEVRQLLGTPLLNDIFHADRWDYLFESQRRGKRDDGKRLTVFFKEDKVVSFAGEGQPPALPPVGLPASPKPAAASPAPAAPAPASR